MPGSIRKRGRQLELRSTRNRSRNRQTPVGEAPRRRALAALPGGALVEFAARVDYPRRMTAQATVANLLKTGMRPLSTEMAPTTARQTKSVIGFHLVPRLGPPEVATLRTGGHRRPHIGDLRQSAGQITASRSRRGP